MLDAEADKTSTCSLYDLVIRPDIIEELRRELHSVLEAHGGEFTSEALHELKYMDSVMKESQRINPGLLSKSS